MLTSAIENLFHCQVEVEVRITGNLSTNPRRMNACGIYISRSKKQRKKVQKVTSLVNVVVECLPLIGGITEVVG